MIWKILNYLLIWIKSENIGNWLEKWRFESGANQTRALATLGQFILGILIELIGNRAMFYKSMIWKILNYHLIWIKSENFGNWLEKWRFETGAKRCCRHNGLINIGECNWINFLKIEQCFTRAWYGKFLIIIWYELNRKILEIDWENGVLKPGRIKHELSPHWVNWYRGM